MLLLLGVALALPQLLLPYLMQLYALHPAELEPVGRTYWAASLLAAVPAGWLVGHGRGRAGWPVAGGAVAAAAGVLVLAAAGAGAGFGLVVAGQVLLGLGGTLLQVAALAGLAGYQLPQTAARHLTAVSTAQAVGATPLPLLGGLLLGGNLTPAQLRGLYLALAVALLAAAALAAWQWGPRLGTGPAAGTAPDETPARALRPLPLGLLAAALCTGLPAGVAALFFFFGESLHLTQLSAFTVARLGELDAGFNAALRAVGQPAITHTTTSAGLTPVVIGALVALYGLAGLLGRLLTLPLLAGLPVRWVLAGSAALAAGLAAATPLAAGDAALWLLVASGLASAPLWPLVAARALAGRGQAAPLAAGLLVLASVAGGVVAGPLLGWLAAHGGWLVAFGAVAAGYGYVVFYALRGEPSAVPPAGAQLPTVTFS